MRCAVCKRTLCINDAKCTALLAVINQVVHQIYLKLMITRHPIPQKYLLRGLVFYAHRKPGYVTLRED